MIGLGPMQQALQRKAQSQQGGVIALPPILGVTR